MEWMKQAFDNSIADQWYILPVRLIAAFVLGLLVVGIYKLTRRAESAAVTFPSTLVLLSILIAMVTQVIGDNAARAFSLVGALSVVRFRTVVRDTKDTAFVIFAVVVGMAAGAGQSVVGIYGLIVIGFAAWLFRDRHQTIKAVSRDMKLAVRLGWTIELERQVEALLAKYGDDIEMISAETIRQGAGMELKYKLQLRSDSKLTQIVAELSRLEGIQSVELDKDDQES